VERTSEERTVKKVCENTAEGKMSVGMSRNMWLYDGENYLKRIAGEK
jgi:hypothetical protein